MYIIMTLPTNKSKMSFKAVNSGYSRSISQCTVYRRQAHQSSHQLGYRPLRDSPRSLGRTRTTDITSRQVSLWVQTVIFEVPTPNYYWDAQDQYRRRLGHTFSFLGGAVGDIRKKAWSIKNFLVKRFKTGRGKHNKFPASSVSGISNFRNSRNYSPDVWKMTMRKRNGFKQQDFCVI